MREEKKKKKDHRTHVAEETPVQSSLFKVRRSLEKSHLVVEVSEQGPCSAAVTLGESWENAPRRVTSMFTLLRNIQKESQCRV